MRFADLPSDWEKQDKTLGPPPAWFRPEYHHPASYYYPNYSYGYPGYPINFYGLGDRPQEVEVNPVEELMEIKYKQELNKSIPNKAYRYTSIDPVSPMFRENRPKYGYGDLKTKKAVLPLIIGALVFYYLLIK